jgi:hypothetical protein
MPQVLQFPCEKERLYATLSPKERDLASRLLRAVPNFCYELSGLPKLRSAMGVFDTGRRGRNCRFARVASPQGPVPEIPGGADPSLMVNRPHLNAFPATAVAAPNPAVPAEATISKGAMRGISPTAFAEQEHGFRWLARRVAGKKCQPVSPRPQDDAAKQCRKEHRPCRLHTACHRALAVI